MMHHEDPETGYVVVVPSYINVDTGVIRQTLEPGPREFPVDGREVPRSEYPELFKILEKLGMVSDDNAPEFKLPDLRGRIIVDGGDHE
ncbi:MAG TPA: phage tail protein [Candidatus Paceibacterota bacterium]